MEALGEIHPHLQEYHIENIMMIVNEGIVGLVIALDLVMSTMILLSKIEGKLKTCYPEWMSLLINMVW